MQYLCDNKILKTARMFEIKLWQIFILLIFHSTSALPFDFVLEKDPKNISDYQRDIEYYTDLGLNFLLFDKHEYTQGTSDL